MLRTLYNTVPSWLVLLSISAIFMGLAATTCWIIKHLFPDFIESENLQSHAIFMLILAITYGIMLGFIIVILWQAFVHVENTVAAEANEFALIIYDSSAFPEKEHKQITNAVANYITMVRNDEWEAMREGKTSVNTFSAMNNLLATVIKYQPQGFNQQIFYKEIIEHLNNGIGYRRERLAAADNALPNTLRTIIIINAILIIMFLCILQGQRKRSDLLKKLLVSGVMGANIGLIFVLDYPFAGDISVNNVAFTRGALANLQSYHAQP